MAAGMLAWPAGRPGRSLPDWSRADGARRRGAGSRGRWLNEGRNVGPPMGAPVPGAGRAGKHGPETVATRRRSGLRPCPGSRPQSLAAARDGGRGQGGTRAGDQSGSEGGEKGPRDAGAMQEERDWSRRLEWRRDIDRPGRRRRRGNEGGEHEDLAAAADDGEGGDDHRQGAPPAVCAAHRAVGRQGSKMTYRRTRPIRRIDE